MDKKQKYTATDELVELFTESREMYFENCPQCMNSLRDEAIKNFGRQGIPYQKNESYRYTDMRPVFQNDFVVLPRYIKQQIDLHDIFNCDVPKLESHLVLMINGWYYARNRKVGNLPDGVICGSLADIAAEFPELIEKYYGKLADIEKYPFAALNTALAKDGLVLYVPDNVAVDKPIQIINLSSNDKATFSTQRNLFILGKNSEAKIIFCDHTLDANNYLNNNLIECFVGEDSRLGFFHTQNINSKSVNITSIFAEQQLRSKLDTNTIVLNGGLIRNNISIALNGEYSEANINGLSLLNGKQHVDNFVTVDHNVPNCSSNQLFKNVVDDEACGVFSGRIHVHSNAQKTSAYQRNNNVLMSDKARMFTKPQLVIDADDVRCSHGATVGRINEDALFYLRSRGIPEKESRLMLMFAFGSEVFENISVEALKDRLADLINRRLRGELNPCQSCMSKCGK